MEDIVLKKVYANGATFYMYRLGVELAVCKPPFYYQIFINKEHVGDIVPAGPEPTNYYGAKDFFY